MVDVNVYAYNMSIHPQYTIMEGLLSGLDAGDTLPVELSSTSPGHRPPGVLSSCTSLIYIGYTSYAI
jgi:hypothetical protein